MKFLVTFSRQLQGGMFFRRVYLADKHRSAGRAIWKAEHDIRGLLAWIPFSGFESAEAVLARVEAILLCAIALGKKGISLGVASLFVQVAEIRGDVSILMTKGKTLR